MKKYSKGQLKFKRIGIFLAFLFVAVLVCSLVMLFGFCMKDEVTVTATSSDASKVSDDIAQNSMPIVIDNLLVGGLYNNTWVSSSKYYLKSANKANVDINVYTKEKKAGTYILKDVYTYGDSVFINTSYTNYIDEYFAVPFNNYSLISQFSNAEIQEQDYSYVKRALGTKRIFNSSINILGVYTAYIDATDNIRLICVSSSSKGSFGGVYSAIIVVVNGKPSILQYSYIKNIDNSLDFPLYSVEFVADLNGDGKSEIVTREVTEFNVTYNVFEFKNSKFTRVLSETMKGK